MKEERYYRKWKLIVFALAVMVIILLLEITNGAQKGGIIFDINPDVPVGSQMYK